MSSLFNRLLRTGVSGLGVFALALLMGCATQPKQDWNALLGVYTYDQSVIDHGPPDKQAELSDGSLVVEWLTSRGGYSGYATGYGAYGYHGRPYGYYPAYAMTPYSVTKTPDRFLRLIFDPEHKLKGWDKFSK